MATKKSKKSEVAGEPIVTVGSHSVRTEYADGRVEFVVDDEKLRADVMEALAMFANTTETPARKVEKPKAKKIKTKNNIQGS